MTKKLTRWLLTIIAMALTFIMLCGTLGAFRGMSASAAEAAPAPSGWYVMGNGAGEQGLKNCSWTEYKADFRLTGTPEEEGETPANYLGTWSTKKLALYQNDQFKILYADGTLAGPNDASWGDGFVVGYYQIPETDRGNFLDGGLGNIQIAEHFDGWYTFHVEVYDDGEGVMFDVTYDYDTETPLPLLVKTYEMYVVGSIANASDIGWPGQEGKTMLPMTPKEVEQEGWTVTKYCSEPVYLLTTDEIKVFNEVNGSYYPGGVENNVAPTSDGWFVVEWTEDAPYIELRYTDLPIPHFPTQGWYLVGKGAGSLYECSWTEYLDNFRLEGESFGDSQSYYGIWKTEPLLLYRGDQFKFIYEGGGWMTPNASGWRNNFVATFKNLQSNNTGNAFSAVGPDSIGVNISGYYTFYIHVSKTSGGESIILTFNRESTSVPSKTLEDMYIVGSIASIPACGWPNDVNVASSCVKMTYNSYDGKWYSPAIRLTETDEFKVFNLITQVYYPSSVNDNFSVATSGWYIIQWESGSQTLTAIPVPNDFVN